MIGGLYGNLAASNPNGPIKTNLIAGFDASITPIGIVSSWSDISGNGYNATEATTGKQPTCTPNQQNSLNTLLFTGSLSQGLQLPSNLYSVPNNDNTIYVVVSITGLGADQRAINMSKSGSGRYKVGFNDAGVGNIATFNSSQASGNGIENTSVTNTVYNVYTGCKSGTTLILGVNQGAELTNSNGANEPAIDSAWIGCQAGTGQFITGGIGQIMIYAAAHTLSQRTYMKALLKQKWATP